MTTTVTVFSDIACPWAAVAVHRLRHARDVSGLDVVVDPRPWPLELVNDRPPSQRGIAVEAAVLAAHEPGLFSLYTGKSWPSTFLPAWEAVAAARRVAGDRAAEELDYTLRLAFFRDGADISQRAELQRVIDEASAKAPEPFDGAAVLRMWDGGTVRADVLADYERSKTLPVQGSPQVFWPDGTTTHNPGMHDVEFVRGIPQIGRADAGEVECLLLAKTTD